MLILGIELNWLFSFLFLVMVIFCSGLNVQKYTHKNLYNFAFTSACIDNLDGMSRWVVAGTECFYRVVLFLVRKMEFRHRKGYPKGLHWNATWGRRRVFFITKPEPVDHTFSFGAGWPRCVVHGSLSMSSGDLTSALETATKVLDENVNPCAKVGRSCVVRHSQLLTGWQVEVVTE